MFKISVIELTVSRIDGSDSNYKMYMTDVLKGCGLSTIYLVTRID